MIAAGDLIDGSWKDSENNKKQLLNWKKTMKMAYNSDNLIGPKIYVTPGNHEIRTKYDEDNFRAVFPNMHQNGPDDEKGLTYSFDFNGTHFVVLATDRWYYGDKEFDSDDRTDWHKIRHMDWLDNDLTNAIKMDSKRIFVFGHDMAFPIGGHLRDGLGNLGRDFKYPPNIEQKENLEKRDKFWKLLKDRNVSAYFCGHEHLYGRQSVDGVYQILAGSSGAPVYNFNPKFKDKDKPLKVGQELDYETAVNYYKAHGYQYGKRKNSQKSKNFFGVRSMQYVIVDVNKAVTVKVYSYKIKENSKSEVHGGIQLLDKFTIK